MNRILSGLVVLFALLALAEPAFACAVCFDANEETRTAFIATTIVLSLLPLGLMGGFIYWLWRRAQAADSQPTHT